MQEIRDKKTLKQIIRDVRTKLMVINFMKKSCPDCKRAKPEVERLALKFLDVVFVIIDVAETPDIGNDFEITEVPIFIFFKDELEVDRVTEANVKLVEQKLQELCY
ncbi:uncharacterized protein [Pyxicephalus adspersus]|uniref:uncharacterized protein n=1 Tax=Pyxicephalus adspersus TaxID=30357 RepID=UPI003B5A66DF